MEQSDGIDAAIAGFEGRKGAGILDADGAEPNHGGYQGEVVLDAVMKLAEEDFLLDELGLYLVLQIRLFYEKLPRLHLRRFQEFEGAVDSADQNRVGCGEGDIKQEDVACLDNPGEELEIFENMPGDQSLRVKHREYHLRGEIDAGREQRDQEAAEKAEDEDADREPDAASSFRAGEHECDDGDEIEI